MRRFSLRHITLCAALFAIFAFTQLTTDAQNWYVPYDYASSSSEPAVNASAAPPGYYFANQACIQSVIDLDDYCVTTDWDQLCQDAYLDCLGCTDLTWYIPVVLNAGPAVYDCTPPSGYYAPDQTCILNVVLADDFCTDNNWDSLCNNTYEACAFGCDAQWHIPIISFNGPAVIGCSPPSGYYTPADQVCLEQTIENDPFCITGNWDTFCQNAFESCAFGCEAQWFIPYSNDGSELPVFGCAQPLGYTTPDQDCVEQVMTDDSFCIVTGWDSPCQNAYELCALGCDAQYYIPLEVGSGPAVLACPGSEPSGYWSPDPFCIQNVINDDSYCVDSFWDSLCQNAFELCSFGCNAQWFLPITVPSSNPAVLDCFAPAGYELATSQTCVEITVANDPFCLQNGWDTICNDDYEACYIGCTYSFACNYAPTHIVDDGSCTEAGCTDPIALNYNIDAGCNNGSCVYGSCPGDFNSDGIIGTGDLLDFLGVFGTTCP